MGKELLDVPNFQVEGLSGGGLWVLEVTYQGPNLTFLYGRQLATK